MHDTGRENLPPVNQTPWAQQLQAGGEEDDACIVTKVTSTDDPLWTMQLSDDDEGGPAEQDCMENDDASSSVVKSEQDCIEIDDPLGSESGERYLRHVQASNFNRNMLPFLKIEESAPWEAAANERNRLNGLLPFLKIEESGHGEKERESSGGAPRKKRKEPEKPEEPGKGLPFNESQRKRLEEARACAPVPARCPRVGACLPPRLPPFSTSAL